MAKKSVTTNKRPTKDPRMNCGVYKITNTANGKFYVGSSCDLKKRKLHHFWLLKNNNHKNQHLQRSYNKNEMKMLFDVIIVCSRDMLAFYEQICIDQLKPEYNKNPVAFQPPIMLKEDHPMFGKKGPLNPNFGKTGSQNSHSKKVIELSKKKIFDSASNAARDLNLKHQNVTSVCRGKSHSCGGYQFAFLDDYLSGTVYVKPLKEAAKTRKHKRPVKNLDTEEIFESLTEAAKVCGSYKTNIHKVCIGEIKTAGGYRFAYHD